nr:FUSC family protein [Gammaproteobacteria bacterium]
IRIDDDLIFIIVPVAVFMAYFSLSKYYVSPTIFTVALTALGSDYYQSNLYAVDQFFFDYAKATIIALSICVFFEYFIFKKNNLTHKFYFDLQKAVVSELNVLLDVVKSRPTRRSQYLKRSAVLYTHIESLSTFLKMAEHDYHLCVHFLDTLEPFNKTLLSAYQNLQILFSEHKPTGRDSLVIETEAMLEQLTRMSHGDQFKGN